MNIDDRPQGPFTYAYFGEFQMAITLSLQRVMQSPPCLVLGWGFRLEVGGSNGAISSWIKFKMAAGGHLEKLQMAYFSNE